MTTHTCLDCGQPSITSACPFCTAERMQANELGWFAQLREDLWRLSPHGNWDGLGVGRRSEEVLRAPKTRRMVKTTEGEPAW